LSLAPAWLRPHPLWHRQAFPVPGKCCGYFRDIQDHVIRLVESIDNLRDLLAAALEAHLLLSSVEQNGIIKIFSVAAVVLMPPTLIASIYGMNFKNISKLLSFDDPVT
jgi:magnesium transporter